MRYRTRIGCSLLGVACLAAHADGPFEVRRLAEGVHLFEVDSDDLEHTNALVVELADGLLVVDSQPSPAAAGEFLEALRDLSAAPVRYLVLSHPHVESGGGASAFPAETRVVAGQACAAALDNPDHDYGAERRARSANPQSWNKPARPGIDLRFSGMIEIGDPRNRVRITSLPAAHSVGHVSVYLPDARVSHVGAVLFARGNPYPGGGSTADWVGTLNQLAREEVDRFVPERGPVVDKAAVRLDRDSFAWIRGQFAAARVDTEDTAAIFEQIRDHPDRPRYFSLSPAPSFLARLVDQLVIEYEREQKKRSPRPNRR